MTSSWTTSFELRLHVISGLGQATQAWVLSTEYWVPAVPAQPPPDSHVVSRDLSKFTSCHHRDNHVDSPFTSSSSSIYVESATLPSSWHAGHNGGPATRMWVPLHLWYVFLFCFYVSFSLLTKVVLLTIAVHISHPGTVKCMGRRGRFWEGFYLWIYLRWVPHTHSLFRHAAVDILPALNTFQCHSLILTCPTSPLAQSSPCQCAPPFSTFNLTYDMILSRSLTLQCINYPNVILFLFLLHRVKWMVRDISLRRTSNTSIYFAKFFLALCTSYTDNVCKVTWRVGGRLS